MTREEIQAEFDAFFEFPGNARGHVTSVSCRLFAKHVADMERIKHLEEIQRLTALANSAEKWRGIAMARDGDGRTVQQVWEEGAAAEREACAKLCESLGRASSNWHAAAIRARGQA